jgi:hypothetical protein
MRKKIFAVLAGAVLTFTFAACKDKAESPIPPHPAGGPPSGMVMPVGETQVIVPESIQGKWSAVTLVIDDKTTNESSEVVVNIGEEYTIPDSSLKISVGDFLPDFKMDGSIITSMTNDLNNPAVNVTVFEGDTEVFSGWLYSKFPAIHPFQHEKYGLTLKDAVAKG